MIQETIDSMGMIPYQPQNEMPNPKSVKYPMSFNSTTQLDRYKELLESNSEELGVKNVQWNTPGHYNHLHVDFY